MDKITIYSEVPAPVFEHAIIIDSVAGSDKKTIKIPQNMPKDVAKHILENLGYSSGNGNDSSYESH